MKKIVLYLIIPLLFSCHIKEANRLVIAGPDEYEAKTKREVFVIDVRTPEEFQQGHLPNALNINYFDPSFEDRIVKYKDQKTVFVYCKSGRRSSAAAEKMIGLGFRKVVNLKGGITAWKDQGKSIIID